MNWKLIFISYFSLFTLGFIDNARGPLYPLILKDLHLSFSNGALFFSVASLFGLLTNLLNKFWLYRFGALNSIRIFSILFIIGTLGIGIFSSSFLSILFFSSLYGISLGGTGISINILVTKSTSSKYRRQALSGLHSMYAIASIISPFVVGLLIEKSFQWSSIFIYISIIPLLLFISTFFVSKNNSLQINKKKIQKLSFLTKIITGGMIAPYVAAEIIISSRLPLYLNNQFNFSQKHSSLYLSYFFIALLIGRALFAVIKFKIKTRQLLKTSIVFSILFFLLGYLVNPIFFSLCGLSMSIYFPTCLEFFSENFPQMIEEITAWIMIVIGVFLIFIHSLFGFISQELGIQNAFCMTLVLLIVTFVFLNIKVQGDKLDQ